MDICSTKKECDAVEQKDMYSVEELYENLEISMLELSRRADINPGTLARIKKGYSARRPTVNKLLRTLSEVYGIRLSVNNVSGIHLEGETTQTDITEEAEKPSISATTPKQTQATSEKPKRVYNRKEKDTGLPAGAMLATEFGRNHGLKDRTFYDHLVIGLGPGVPWGMGDEMTVEKEHVDYSERVKPGRPKEKERYLTQEQQKAALKFWRKHNVSFQECDQPECPCHI